MSGKSRKVEAYGEVTAEEVLSAKRELSKSFFRSLKISNGIQRCYEIFVRAGLDSFTISSIHCRLFYAPVQVTLAELRQRFWVLKGRREIKKVIGKCKACFVELDCGGPITVKFGSQKIVLYTCLTSKAIHLKVVKNLRSEMNLNCLRRFTVRREALRII
ncbi:unnamed protein product [Enterobius vermicularis]|uniref:Integrase_H2C2 domain-containing protein n=1 Tax=Enterobius vermicularis TaxID=51028 RepID=A0A0N4VE89_ENTVE|nr:unnamed protein product [Enterobius vermicularis]